MLPLSYEQAAVLAKVTVRHLHRLRKEGTAPAQTPDGRFEVEAFSDWLEERYREKHGVATDGETYDYNAERGRLTKAQADKAEIELAALRGDLMGAKECREVWTDYVAACRARLILLAPTIAPLLASGHQIAETQALIQEHVYQALNELAGLGHATADPPDDTVGERGMEGAAKSDGERMGGSGEEAK